MPQKPKKISEIPVFCNYDKAVDLEEIVPNPRNPNGHPDKQVALLSKIIRHQGWRHPIVVSLRSGFITKGHGRLEAAKLLNVAQAPVEYQQYDSDAVEWADMIADNRIAELAELEMATLKDVLLELDTGDLDMDLTGWDQESLEKLMTDTTDPTNGELTFSEELKEAHNYVVLYFSNEIDWTAAKTKLGITSSDAFKSRTDRRKKGVGRVIGGTPVIDRLPEATA